MGRCGGGGGGRGAAELLDQLFVFVTAELQQDQWAVSEFLDRESCV